MNSCMPRMNNMPDMNYSPSGNVVLAMGMVNWQPPHSPMYNVEQGLIAGTIYKDLDKPFLAIGGACVCR